MERVVRDFPKRGVVLRLAGATLVDIDGAWTIGYRYPDMTEY
jgi:hypothetical protein